MGKRATDSSEDRQSEPLSSSPPGLSIEKGFVAARVRAFQHHFSPRLVASTTRVNRSNQTPSRPCSRQSNPASGKPSPGLGFPKPFASDRLESHSSVKAPPTLVTTGQHLHTPIPRTNMSRFSRESDKIGSGHSIQSHATVDSMPQSRSASEPVNLLEKRASLRKTRRPPERGQEHRPNINQQLSDLIDRAIEGQNVVTTNCQGVRATTPNTGGHYTQPSKGKIWLAESKVLQQSQKKRQDPFSHNLRNSLPSKSLGGSAEVRSYQPRAARLSRSHSAAVSYPAQRDSSSNHYPIERGFSQRYATPFFRPTTPSSIARRVPADMGEDHLPHSQLQPDVQSLARPPQTCEDALSQAPVTPTRMPRRMESNKTLASNRERSLGAAGYTPPRPSPVASITVADVIPMSSSANRPHLEKKWRWWKLVSSDRDTSVSDAEISARELHEQIYRAERKYNPSGQSSEAGSVIGGVPKTRPRARAHSIDACAGSTDDEGEEIELVEGKSGAEKDGAKPYEVMATGGDGSGNPDVHIDDREIRINVGHGQVDRISQALERNLRVIVTMEESISEVVKVEIHPSPTISQKHKPMLRDAANNP